MSWASLLVSGGTVAVFGIPWLVDTSCQSLPSHSHGVFPVCVSISRFPPFHQDTSHVGRGAHPTPGWASQVALVVKNLPPNAGDIRDTDSIPGSGRFPWRRARQPTPVFLPGESCGERSLLEGYSPWGCKESDMTEVT